MFRIQSYLAILVVMLAASEFASAQGRGGGLRGGGGGGGGAAAAAAAARPNISRPNASNPGAPSPISRPSTPNLGNSRPATNRPNVNQPSARPPVNQPAASLPANRPSLPSSNRPSGGLAPSTRPALPPNTGTRPNLPSAPSNRPGTGPSVDASRPITRPNTSLPNLGDRPITGNLPGSATRPGVGDRPNLPARPGTGDRPGLTERPAVGDRPSLPNRPGTSDVRPLPGIPGTRPDIGSRPGIGSQPGGTNRPSLGDLGDFLGMDRPLRPGGDTAVTLPGNINTGDRPVITNRPGGDTAVTLPGNINTGDRPVITNRPGGDTAVTLPGNINTGDRPVIINRPGGDTAVTLPGNINAGDRPGINNRPGVVDRPNLGDRSRWPSNTVISQRPSWVNIDNSVNVNINNRWNTAFVNPAQRGWWNRPPARIAFWGGWASGVRSTWIPSHRNNIWFTPVWWGRHPFPVGGWHFHFWRHSFPARHWWTVPAWGSVTTWFTWNAPPVVWDQPVFYDFGSGGNVVFQNNDVFIGGERVATAEEYAMSAMNLATVTPPHSDEQAEAAEWMPLGTFAVSTNEKDVEPSHVVQIAISREGILSGTLYNIDIEKAQSIQGQLDKDTQRVAFRIGESDSIVAETGLYNLTQDEAPVLIHFGAERTEEFLLVRLEYSEEEE